MNGMEAAEYCSKMNTVPLTRKPAVSSLLWVNHLTSLDVIFSLVKLEVWEK